MAQKISGAKVDKENQKHLENARQKFIPKLRVIQTDAGTILNCYLPSSGDITAADAPSVMAEEIKDSLPTSPGGKTWKLIWHDEFDGNKLDESKWVARPDGKRKGGWWSRKAISLDGSCPFRNSG